MTVPQVLQRVAALACLVAVHAQQALVSPAGCDWASLPTRVAGAESACCLGLAADLPWSAVGGVAGVPCGRPAPSACSVDCAIKLVPLVNGTCAPLLGALFDASDGARDGDPSLTPQTNTHTHTHS